MLTDLDYDLLSAYIDGALTDSERAELESRLQTDLELRTELDELRATVLLLNNLPLRKAPRDFTLDARYARRSSVFFTSAAFSALSTAAAVILFAVGAYLFTSNKTGAPTSSSPASDIAFASTSTGATLDKSAVTPTEQPLLNQSQASTIPTDLDGQTGQGITDGYIQGETATSEQAFGTTDQLPLVQGDDETATEAPPADSAAAPPANETQNRVEVTETTMSQMFEAQPTMGAIAGGAASASPAEQADTSASSMMMAATPTTPSIPAPMIMPATLAATELPLATQSLTATPSPTATLVPTDTPSPTSVPEPVLAPPAPDSLPIALIVLGAGFLLLAVATTIVRRRNRA